MTADPTLRSNNEPNLTIPINETVDPKRLKFRTDKLEQVVSEAYNEELLPTFKACRIDIIEPHITSEHTEMIEPVDI